MGVALKSGVARMVEHPEPRPVGATLKTPGVAVLVVLGLIGASVAAYRFLFGIGSVTNLDQQHPWGIWIGIDVATGVALAAGGFTTSALAHIFHREHYHAIVRPALLTAMLGYTFVVLGLLADLGRYYNVWHPVWPTMWSGHSALFEVGICVTLYLTVLYLEFAPIVCERLRDDQRWPTIAAVAEKGYRVLGRFMPLLIIAGVVLSCAHQSSLGTLMVIAPTKMHPLWWTPVLPMLFLLSAFAVGFPMVIFENLYASWSLKLKPEMHILTPLSRYIPFLLGLYIIAKATDLFARDAYVYLAEGSTQSVMFIIEMLFGVLLPFAMLLSKRVRRSPRGLLIASVLIVLGVALNRVNVFLVAYQPVYPERSYFPALGEIAVTVGLIATLMLCYRVIVTYFPVISHPGKVETA